MISTQVEAIVVSMGQLKQSVCVSQWGGGGRSNGPYADSLPLSTHFQGGGGAGSEGGLGASLGGGGGAPGPQHIWLKMTALSR